MKKMIKMSLVAAVAVAGLSTTASAINLAEFAKATEMKGYVRYRLNQNHESAGSTNSVEETKAVMKWTTPVNDMVTANLKFVALADTGSGTVGGDKGVTVAPLNAAEGNFVIKAAGATLTAGLQTTQSPFAANNGDTRSHGVTALIPAGSVTIAAAHYTTTTTYTAPVTTDNLTAFGAIAKLGNANVEAWYATLEGAEDANTALLASAKMGAVNVSAAYATGADDHSNMKLAVSGKAGAISYLVGYGTSGEQGNATFDNDTDGKLALTTTSAKISTATSNDVSAMVADVTMPAGPVTLGLQYLTGEAGDADLSSMTVRLGKKLSKNFGLSAWYAMEEVGAGNDVTNSRIEAKWSF